MSLDFSTPRKILKAYKDGLAGAICDPEDLDKLLGELPHPVFGAAANNLYGTGEGKLALLYKSVQKYDPSFGYHERQETGDCYYGETIIMDNACKKIKDINVGDTIYDSNGNFTKVISKQVKISNNTLITIKTKGSIPLRVTSDHRVLIGRKEEDTIGNTVTKIVTRKWVTAQEIKKGDYLITPTSLTTISPPTNKFITNDFSWFLGYFLGDGWCDDKQLAEAKSAMDRVQFKPFSIHIGRIGRFRRRGGDLWWAGVSENQPLTQLHAELTDNLREAGFQIEKRRFSPHITLGREIVTNASPRLIEKFRQTVESVKLMKSERISGKLVYTSIYEKSSRSSSLLNQS